MPRLSVVTPVRNRAHIVGESVRNSLDLADEVIVVDTGSTDDSIAVAEAAGARVVTLAKEDFTYSRARNLGAGHATGDWILQKDSDELMHARYRPVLEAAMASGDFDVWEFPQLNKLASGSLELVTQRRLYRHRAGYYWGGLAFEWLYPLADAGIANAIILNHNHAGRMAPVSRAIREALMLREIEALRHAGLDTALEPATLISRCRHLCLHARHLIDTEPVAALAWKCFVELVRGQEQGPHARHELGRFLEAAGKVKAAYEIYRDYPLLEAPPIYLNHFAAVAMAAVGEPRISLGALDHAIARCPSAIFYLNKASIEDIIGDEDGKRASVEALQRLLPELLSYGPRPPTLA